MKKYILFSMLIGFAVLLSACGQNNGSSSLSAPSVQSLSVSPEAVAPGGTVKINISSLNTDGTAIAYKIGTEETTFCSNEASAITYKVSQTSGAEEVNIYLSNGRVDTLNKLYVNIDSSLPATTLHSGRATLPINKSFDFFNGTVVDANYGDIDYDHSNYYGDYLDTGSSRTGSSYSSYVSKGIINLTHLNPNCKNLNQVVEPYTGSYNSYAYQSENSYYASSVLKVNNVYCVKLQYTSANTFFAKIKVLSISSSDIVFDWVFQSAPNVERFYDVVSAQSYSAPFIAPVNVTATSYSSSTINVSWDAVYDSSVTGYRVYRSNPNNGAFFQVGSVTGTSYSDTLLSASTPYYYKVKTVYSYNRLSDYSYTICATTQATGVSVPVPPPPTPVLVTLFSDNGESGSSRWTASGFTLSTARSYSTSHSYYSGRGNSIINTLTLANPISISGSKTLQFRTYYYTESSFDYLYVQVSTNGTNWNTLESFCGSSSSAWISKSYSLAAYSGSSIYIRFKYQTDSSVDYEGVYIDDIKVE